MRILWEEQALEDYLGWQMEDKKTLRKINRLIKDIQRNRYEGIGKPEPLKENYSGWWSRRIDEENRTGTTLVLKVHRKENTGWKNNKIA